MSLSAFSFRSFSPSFAFASESFSILLFAFHARKKLVRHRIELGSLDVVARLRHVGLRLLLLDAVLRLASCRFPLRPA